MTQRKNIYSKKNSFGRSDFPEGFLFGTASSAYQYEGAINEAPRGECVWDTFVRKYPVGANPNGIADPRLPGRLFATDRYPNARLNIYSRPDIISFVRETLRGKTEFDIIRSSAFGKLFDLPVSHCPPSCKLIYGLIVRQVVTKKKYEMWSIFGGHPVRFSLQEFGCVTGLNCGEFPEFYDHDYQPPVQSRPTSFWTKLIGHDQKTTLADIADILSHTPDMPTWRRLALSLLLIVDGVLIATHQTHKPTPKYVEMLEDIDSFLSFPWGRESFLRTLSSLKPTKKIPGKPDDPVHLFQHQLQQQTIKLNGFPLALQLVAFECIPSVLAKLPNSGDRSTIYDKPFCGLQKQCVLTKADVLQIENSPELIVKPYLLGDESSPTGAYDWDDEVRDKKIDHMEALIKTNHTFSKPEWPGGFDSLPLVFTPPPPPSVPHKKHIHTRIECTPKTKTSLRPRQKPAKKTKAKSSKRKQRTIHDYFKDPPPDSACLKDWIAGKLQEQAQMFALQIKHLTRRTNYLEKRLNARQTNSSLKLSSKHFRFIRRKKKRIPELIPTPNPSLQASPDIPLHDLTLPGCLAPDIAAHTHVWDDYGQLHNILQELRDTEVNPHAHSPVDKQPPPYPSVHVPIHNHPSLDTSASHRSPLHVSLDNIDPHTFNAATQLAALQQDPPPKLAIPHGHSSVDKLPPTYLSAPDQDPMVLERYDFQQAPSTHTLPPIPSHMVTSSHNATQAQPTTPIAPTPTALPAPGFLLPHVPCFEGPNKVPFQLLPLQPPLMQNPPTLPNHCQMLQPEPLHPSAPISTIPLHPNAELTETPTQSPKHDEHTPTPTTSITVDIPATNYVPASHHTDSASPSTLSDTICLDDSPTPTQQSKHQPSASQLQLATYFHHRRKPGQADLLPKGNKAEFDSFQKTLQQDPTMTHLTKCNFYFSNQFLLNLAHSQEWTSTLHMEVLMSHLQQRHSLALVSERATFVSPWLINHLQGKLRSFKAAKDKCNFRWGDSIKKFVMSPGLEWFKDIDTVYAPMIWKDNHWVGLAINLGMWLVEVLDPCPSLYADRKVITFMEPVLTLLPHIINTFCDPPSSQACASQPFLMNRVPGLYVNSRMGDCGPVAVKFMELHAHDSLDSAKERLTDQSVDAFRKQYAMDIYADLVAPLYASPDITPTNT